MEKTEILALFDHDQRIALDPPDGSKTAFPDLVRHCYPAPRMNSIAYSNIAIDQLDARIQAEIEYFTALNQPFSWQYYQHDQAPHLVAKLLEHGFLPDDDPDAVMLLDLEADQPVFHHNDRVTVQSIGIDQVDSIAQIEAQVWGADFDWLTQRLRAHLQIKDYLEVFVATIDNKPVSSGWVYFYPQSHFAGLFGGASLAEYRGQGLYNSLLAARIQAARKRGYRFVFTGANQNSQPILANHGFRLLSKAYSHTWAGRT